jgi:hypothetical protein
MNIYGFKFQNDPYEAQVLYAGIGIEPKSDVYESVTKEFLSAEQLSEILTWGCLDNSMNITFSQNNFSVCAEKQDKMKVRKVDLKSKTQWLD